MSLKIYVGLPYLSNGPLLRKTKEMKAPILLSANAFARFLDLGPIPERLRPKIDPLTGGPPSPSSARRHMREWDGWNLNSLRHLDPDQDVILDSAGFHYQAAAGGYPFTPEAYIHGLASQYPFTRFSSLDLCCEQEIAGNRQEIAERVSKTIHLNKRCAIAARDLGIEDRLMPIIQGSTPSDYLACFDALSGLIGEQRLIGVGSMCRRPTTGPLGVPAIVDALHAALPPGITLHLFGVKGDALPLIKDMDGRVASSDSQAYGIHARQLANKQRKIDPGFSKSNAFVAEVMTEWVDRQRARLETTSRPPIQNSFLFSDPPAGRSTTHPRIDHLEALARDQINALIEQLELDYDQIVGDRILEQWIADLIEEEASDEPPLHTLPSPAISNVLLNDDYRLAA